ncbi:MAG: hypothetical protein WC889_11060, partial [Myxococcota bacterium]
FDLYDRLFAHHFQGAELVLPGGEELDAEIRAMLEEWLKTPELLAEALGLDPGTLAGMTQEELVQYFKDRLKEQTEQHHGGNKWIGTGGTSPVGHSGFHPGGMRVGGDGHSRSAVKVAMDRRYRDYSQQGPLTQAQLGEALKRLRNMVPAGPRDMINIDETIRQTVKNAGEIEIFYERSLRDRLKVILAIDNGGWSMDPYIDLVQTLFHYARSQFKDVRTFYFHNTIYESLWEDPQRRYRPVAVDELPRIDPETRFILVGDASMANWELNNYNGSIHYEERSGLSSWRRLQFISDTFRHSVWLNPVPERNWRFTFTISQIAQIFPMFELTLDGLEGAVSELMK